MSSTYRILLLLVLGGLLQAGCSAQHPRPEWRSARGDEAAVTVYVVSHGWHTGIVVPRQVLGEQMVFLGEPFNRAPYVEFGWGDEGFYRAETVTVGLGVQAIFWPTATVMHVVAVTQPPERFFPASQVRPLVLTPEGSAALLEHLEASFDRDDAGQVVALGPGLYGESRFFRARGAYWALNTCNVWTAEALRATGYPIQAFGALTAGRVMEQLPDDGQRVPCAVQWWFDDGLVASCRQQQARNP